MENATKALLIAAAVLVAIVLIALGIKLLSASKGSIDIAVDASSEMEVSMINSQFESYEGQHMSVSQVKKLARKVLTYNTKNTSNVIYINSISTTTEINAWISELNNNPEKRYTVSISDYYATSSGVGLIKTISVTQE